MPRMRSKSSLCDCVPSITVRRIIVILMPKSISDCAQRSSNSPPPSNLIVPQDRHAESTPCSMMSESAFAALSVDLIGNIHRIREIPSVDIARNQYPPNDSTGFFPHQPTWISSMCFSLWRRCEMDVAFRQCTTIAFTRLDVLCKRGSSSLIVGELFQRAGVAMPHPAMPKIRRGNGMLRPLRLLIQHQRENEHPWNCSR